MPFGQSLRIACVPVDPFVFFQLGQVASADGESDLRKQNLFNPGFRRISYRTSITDRDLIGVAMMVPMKQPTPTKSGLAIQSRAIERRIDVYGKQHSLFLSISGCESSVLCFLRV